MIEAMLAFAVFAGLITITPGLDTMLVLRTTAVGGARAGAAAAAGIQLGCLVWATAGALGVTAVLRMGQGLTHSTHTHDDCDEIILVLNGEGSQLFQEEDGTEIRYDLHPDDLLYIAKNRVHRTDNLSKTDDLELFIINYFYGGQSDVHVKGFLPGACSTAARMVSFIV